MSGSRDDATAFADVFERHRHGVHAFLLGKTSDPEAARDLLQEAFLRLWRRFDELAAFDEGRQRAWLFTVARNLVIDRYRARATQQTTLEAMARESERARNPEPDPAEPVAAREELASLQRAIDELPEEQRVILSMVAVGGMTSQQVGEALTLPPGTVRYRLHQARARLASQMEG
jgi:RNA polymerase sigma-70 factor, ECF subfamily